MYQGTINHVSVDARYPYIVYSVAAGLVSQHRMLSAALGSLIDYRRRCYARGRGCDAAMYLHDGENWKLLEPAAYTLVSVIMGRR